MLLASLMFVVCQVAAQDVAQAVEASFTSLDNGLRHKQVYLPGSREECLAVMFRVGHDHDPVGQTGLAEVVGEALVLAQDGPETQRFQVVVRGAFTLLWATVPTRDLERPMGFLDALLGGRLVLDDDLLQRAIAKAALRADDESMVFPGPVQRQRAQRAVLAGSPQGRQYMGIPTEMQALTPDGLRRRLAGAYRPRHAILTALGGATEEFLAEPIAALAALPGGDLTAVPAVAHDPLPDVELVRENPHVTAPFVSAVLRTPGRESPEFLPFLIANEVLRTRAGLFFRDFRGGESLARFPFLDHHYMEGDPIALVNRRGANGSTLEDVKAELAQFLVAQSQGGVTPGAAGSAVRAIGLEMSLPPYEARLLGPMVQQGALLLPRARALCLYELWGWPTDVRARLEAVPVEEIQAALRKYFDPEQLTWLALVPVPGD